jgi:hypothetical protein
MFETPAAAMRVRWSVRVFNWWGVAWALLLTLYWLAQVLGILLPTFLFVVVFEVFPPDKGKPNPSMCAFAGILYFTFGVWCMCSCGKRIFDAGKRGVAVVKERAHKGDDA